MKRNNIVLIGFMGVGKGTTARLVAKKSGMMAVDTDDLIESLTKKPIRKIFEKRGEAYFRALEQRVADWLATSVENTIISTGGGFYKVERLGEIGTIIYLRASFEWIYNRIALHPNAKAKFAKRPLFKEKKRARELYESRKTAYDAAADVIIDVENKSNEELLEEIFRLECFSLKHR
ncbi:MAG: shikimate kinase [Campylobacterales bacterium]